MKSAILVVLAGITLMLAACNRTEQDRPASILPGAELSAPPAPAERGAPSGNAIALAAGTDTEAAFSAAKPATLLPSPKGGAPEAQAINVRAQEAAAKAPDTASADAARNKVLNEAAN